MSNPTACLIIVGNEILSGRTRDANLQYLGTALGEIGIRLMEVRVIADDEAAIVKAVNKCRADYTYVFTTGGIGPTHDDITSASVAKAFGVSLERNAAALECLGRYYKPKDLNEARLRMADVPQGAELIDNPVSQAPGFRLANVYVMAGVPRIMQAMFDGIKNTLRGGAKMLSRTVTIFLPEGLLAQGLAAIQTRHPELEIGSYPFVRLDRLGAAIVVRGTDAAAIGYAAAEVRSLATTLGGEIEEDDGA